MSLDRPAWNVQRSSPTVSGEGVETPAWATVYTGILASLNRPMRRSDFRREAERNAGGPGVQTVTEEVAILHLEDFPSGFPVIRVGDRLSGTGGAYEVQHVRDSYETTLQLDVEVVR